jgi:hypothetical protein
MFVEEVLPHAPTGKLWEARRRAETNGLVSTGILMLYRARLQCALGIGVLLDDEMERAADDRARGVVIRRLRRALEDRP